MKELLSLITLLLPTPLSICFLKRCSQFDPDKVPMFINGKLSLLCVQKTFQPIKDPPFEMHTQ
jgi:hypothetical protein